MIRISKLTDYGFVVLNQFASHGAGDVVNARDLAEETGLPMPTVSKVLKLLARGGVLAAHRGVNGGYKLARPAQEVTAAEVIEALEGPVAFTDCSGADGTPECERETHCELKAHWRVITDVVRGALSGVSLAQLAGPAEDLGRLSGGNACAGDACTGGTDVCGCGTTKDRFKHNGVTR